MVISKNSILILLVFSFFCHSCKKEACQYYGDCVELIPSVKLGLTQILIGQPTTINICLIKMDENCESFVCKEDIELSTKLEVWIKENDNTPWELYESFMFLDTIRSSEHELKKNIELIFTKSGQYSFRYCITEIPNLSRHPMVMLCP